MNKRMHLSNCLILERANRTFGYITTRELNQMGFTNPMIHAMVANGELIRVERGVYAVGHTCSTRVGTWYAAMRAAGEGAALTHTTAARFWKLEHGDSRLVEIAVPKPRRPRRSFTSILVPDMAGHVVASGPIRVMSPVRTIIDLSGRYHPGKLARLIKEGQHLDLFDISQVEGALGRMKPGLPREGLTDALYIRRHGGDGADSALEDQFVAHLASYPIPRPIQNARYSVPGRRRPIRVDADFQDLDIIGEIDGRHTHRTAEQKAEDRRRDADLGTIGKRVFRVAEDDFRRDPIAACRELVVAVMEEMVRRGVAT